MLFLSTQPVDCTRQLLPSKDEPSPHARASSGGSFPGAEPQPGATGGSFGKDDRLTGTPLLKDYECTEVHKEISSVLAGLTFQLILEQIA